MDWYLIPGLVFFVLLFFGAFEVLLFPLYAANWLVGLILKRQRLDPTQQKSNWRSNICLHCLARYGHGSRPKRCPRCGKSTAFRDRPRWWRGRD